MTNDAYMLVLDKNGPTGSEWTVRKCPEGIDLKFRKDWYPNYRQAWGAAQKARAKRVPRPTTQARPRAPAHPLRSSITIAVRHLNRLILLAAQIIRSISTSSA